MRSAVIVLRNDDGQVSYSIRTGSNVAPIVCSSSEEIAAGLRFDDGETFPDGMPHLSLTIRPKQDQVLIDNLHFLEGVFSQIYSLRFSGDLKIEGLAGIEYMRNLKSFCCIDTGNAWMRPEGEETESYVTSLHGLEWCDSLEKLALSTGVFQVSHLRDLQLRNVRVEGDSRATSWQLDHLGLETLTELQLSWRSLPLLVPEIFPRLRLKTLTLNHEDRPVITEEIRAYINHLLQREIHRVGIKGDHWCVEVLTDPYQSLWRGNPRSCAPIIRINLTHQGIDVKRTDFLSEHNTEQKILGFVDAGERMLQDLAVLLGNSVEPMEKVAIVIDCYGNLPENQIIVPNMHFLGDIAQSVISIRMWRGFKIASLTGIERCENLEVFGCEEHLADAGLEGLERCQNLKELSISLRSLETAHLRELPLRILRINNAENAENLKNLYSHNLTILELDEVSSQFLPDLVLPGRRQLEKITICPDPKVNESVLISEQLASFVSGCLDGYNYVFSNQDGCLVVAVNCGISHL